MSVWQDIESLHAYVYRSAHARIMARRKAWFEHMRSAYVVLWWVPRDHRPGIDEALARLEALRQHGPHSEAFTFRRPFPPPHTAPSGAVGPFTAECPAC